MGKSLKDIKWPAVYVVVYRNGVEEKMFGEFDGQGTHLIDSDEGEPEGFFGWPAKAGKNETFPFAKYGRICFLEDIERIVSDRGEVLWEQEGGA